MGKNCTQGLFLNKMDHIVVNDKQHINNTWSCAEIYENYEYGKQMDKSSEFIDRWLLRAIFILHRLHVPRKSY